MTLTTASRHSTRLETLGRTVKHYIPHTLSSFSPLSLSNTSSNDRHQAAQSGISPQSARPVSFGHYNLSGLQAPRFGQPLGEDGVPPFENENENDDIIHAAWYNPHGRWVPRPLTTSNVTPADPTHAYVAQYTSLPYPLSRSPTMGSHKPRRCKRAGPLPSGQLPIQPYDPFTPSCTRQRPHTHPHAPRRCSEHPAPCLLARFAFDHPPSCNPLRNVHPSIKQFHHCVYFTPVSRSHVFSSTIPEFPLLHVQPMSQTSNPIFALSGRLLAYSSPTPPSSATDANKYAYATSKPRPTSTSVAIMDTAVKGAVDISSGVWSGVKALGGMALDAASRSTSSDNGGPRFGFSKSVPNSSSPLGMLGVGKRLSEVFSGSGTPRIDESGQTGAADKGNAFVTVVDLMPVHGPMSSPRKLAEFCWVDSPRTNSHSSQGISSLAWNPNGTQLAVSGTDGLVARVSSIRPQSGPSLAVPLHHDQPSTTVRRPLGICTSSNMY